MPDHSMFLVTTVADKGKSKYRSQINSHTAHVKHAKKRILTKSRQSQSEESEPVPQVPHKGVGQQRATDDRTGVQKPWLIATRPHGETQPDDMLCLELVPPVRWTIELTSYEKNMLHFGLDKGRQFALSEGSTPGYSLVSDWAQRFLESTKMYSICHVVMAEQFMYILYGRQPTKVFYARQAHAYRLMNYLLNSEDESITSDDKLLAFSQVIVMDLILGKDEVRRQHARAVDEYIELCGGLRHILAMPRDSRSAFDPWRFIIYFCYAELPTPTYLRTQAVMTRTLANLRYMREWAKSITTKEQKDAVMSSESRVAINTVHDYALWALNHCWKEAEKRYFADISAIIFIYILCLAQAKYSYTTAEILRFFSKLAPRVAQRNVKGAIAIFPRPHPVSGISSMAYIRDDVRLDKAKEVFLCEAAVDMVRVTPLLPVASISRLAQTWIDCAFQPVGFPLPESADSVESLSEESLREMERELWSTWSSASHGEATLK